MKPIFILSFLCIASTTIVNGQHHADPSADQGPVKSKIILQQLLADSGLENREIKMLIVDFPPKSGSQAHRHPCPTFGYVLEGEIESIFEGKTYLYKKGDSFYEVTNGLHSGSRNNHPSQPAKLLVFFVGEKDKPTTIPEKQ